VRQTLDQAIGVAPASTVDVDRVVAKGRFRRRLAVAGAAGGTALAAVGLIAALTLTTGPRPGPGPGPTEVQPAAPDGGAPVRAGETPEQTTARLVTALTDGLTSALPGVRLTDGPTGQAGVVVFSDARHSADIVLTTAAGPSEVFFESWPGGDQPESSAPTDWPSGQPAPPVAITWIRSCAELPHNETIIAEGHRVADECQESTGAGGQTIVAITERCLDCATPTTYRYDVYVTWTNARVGLSINRDTKRGPAGSGAAPLLTLEQLVAIAADPRLTVTP